MNYSKGWQHLWQWKENDRSSLTWILALSPFYVYLHVSVYMSMSAGSRRDQNRIYRPWNSWNWAHRRVCHPTQVLRVELWSFAREAHALNCSAISPSSVSSLYNGLSPISYSRSCNMYSLIPFWFWITAHFNLRRCTCVCSYAVYVGRNN